MRNTMRVVSGDNEGLNTEAAHSLYLQTQTLVERLHHRLFHVIEDEFNRRQRKDLNAVQALMIYNIGAEELSAGDLRKRGCYFGTNVSYTVKKLVDLGFLDYQRSRVDRRGVRIRLTSKGREVRDIVEALYEKHSRTIGAAGDLRADELARLNKSMQRLERFWTDQVLYRL